MSAVKQGASVRSAGVRRLLQEAQELERDDCADYAAAPLEDDIFSWHFTVRGPKSTDFEGGVYHGRLVLPSEYPFKPPEVYMLTPSGRFEVNKKICLSISSFHPETWQPSWGIRTALVALMAFFDSEAKGAVGSLDAPPAERQRMARTSRYHQCATCGFDAAKPESFAALPAPTPNDSVAVEADHDDVPVLVAEVAAPPVVVAASEPIAVHRKPPPASIETTIFSTSTASVRSPSAARHATPREPQAPLDPHSHNPFSAPIASPSTSSFRHRVSQSSTTSPSLDSGPTSYVPPGAPRLSPAHLPARNPFSASAAAALPNPLRTPDVTAADDAHLRPVPSSTGPASPAAPAAAATERDGVEPEAIQLPALPPGVSLAQVSSGGVGGPPSWVDRAIVACLLALVALVVRKIA